MQAALKKKNLFTTGQDDSSQFSVVFFILLIPCAALDCSLHLLAVSIHLARFRYKRGKKVIDKLLCSMNEI